MSAWSALKFKPKRENEFCAICQVTEILELFKKLEPGAQFQWELISSAVQSCCSQRGSEADPTTSSRYSYFLDCERSLDPGRLRRALRHSRINGVPPIDLSRLSAFGSDWRRGNVLLDFCLHTTFPDKDWPKYVCLSASQWLSRSGIKRSG